MPTIPLPEDASLEHLKSQAKLVRDLIRSGDEGGLSMVDEFHPRLRVAELDEAQRAAFKLSDAQLIIARLYRCASWNKLRDHLDVVASLRFTPGPERDGYVENVESFVELACLNYAQHGPNPHDRIARAHQMLAADPSLATGSIEAAATVGDHAVVAAMLGDRDVLANEPCGPNAWPPLLYATYSRVQTDNPAWSLTKTVEVLLAAGADPNAGFLWRGLVPPFTALTGSIGNGESGQPWLPERFDIARLLLEAGADPNDGQALYNNGIGGENHDDPTHLELLLEFGLGTQLNGPWYERLGSRLRDPHESLYDELEAAVIRARPNHVRVLIGLGLDLDRPVGRSQKTPVRLAAEHGNHEILELLAASGIDAAMEPTEQFLDAIRRSDPERLAEILAANPAIGDTIRDRHADAIKAVTANGAGVLETLLGLGLDINARTGGSGTTALHDAAQANDVPLARLLIEHGVDPNLVDRHIGATPWGWANHFHHDDVRDYLAPLTDRNETIDVKVLSSVVTNQITTVGALRAALRGVEAEIAAAELVRFDSGGATLSVGIGHPDSCVVLYLDRDGRPWHATDATRAGAKQGSLTLATPRGPRSFDASRTVGAATMRDVVEAFAHNPEQRPQGVVWHREGETDQL